MTSLATYWHTLKYLKPVQIYSRVTRRLAPKPRVARETPPIVETRGAWAEPVRLRASMIGPQTFRFLNEERMLAESDPWRAEGASLLWRYNLHYFDDLIAAGAADRAVWHQSLVASWIADNPPGSSPAWDSYPISLRAVNWIKWSLGGGSLSPAALDSLARQVRWLRARLEWHLLGNHLFANAKALAFAGCFFGGGEADRWLKRAGKILHRELDEQILPDGGNFELSPMYHAILLADVLDLLNLAAAYPGKMAPGLIEALQGKARAMLEWLAAMVHPDGQIALFNDSAIGIAPTLDELAAYAARIGLDPPSTPPPAEEPSLRLLQPSGYARLETRGAVAICDVAPVGPDYLPGHAHADTLSFELSVAGQRIVVNGGTSRYGSDEARVRERGTAAHSTVIVDECDSSEVWGGFRVARRARPMRVEGKILEQGVRLEGSHDGYGRLHRDIVHRRAWTLFPRSLVVEDRVEGPWRTATARFLLHHGAIVRQSSENVWQVGREGSGEPVVVTVRGGAGRVVPAEHSMEFGRRYATTALLVDLDRAGSNVEIAW
jgi:uncharacterized heparinase superfamily protein